MAPAAAVAPHSRSTDQHHRGDKFPPFFMPRLLFLLVLLSASLPAMAEGGGSSSAVDTSTQQNNDNSAQSQSQASQSNRSRSESVGGSIINQQYNNSVGELSQTAISENQISCESGSFYVSAGAYPQDSFGFYSFENNRRQMQYVPQANLGIQVPFGPSIAACVDAQKNKVRQIKIGTESGIFKTCVSTKINATKAEIPLQLLSEKFPQLTENCSAVWGI